MNDLKFALEESRKILDFYIENINEDWSEEDINSMGHYVDAINSECQCDSYNGYHCGCDKRWTAFDLGKKALNKLKTQQNEYGN